MEATEPDNHVQKTQIQRFLVLFVGILQFSHDLRYFISVIISAQML